MNQILYGQVAMAGCYFRPSHYAICTAARQPTKQAAGVALAEVSFDAPVAGLRFGRAELEPEERRRPIAERVTRELRVL